MKEIKITEKEALEIHKSGVESLKSIAESNFPELFNKEKKWEDFGMVEGFYADGNCEPHIYKFHFPKSYNKDVNPTKKECEMDIAMCQLRQWRDKANGESIFDWCDWDDDNQLKYLIYRLRNEIFVDETFSDFRELAFKTRAIRGQFLKDHKTLIHTSFGL